MFLFLIPILLLVLIPALNTGLMGIFFPPIPAFTIKEFVEHPQPQTLINKQIILIGTLTPEINSTGFYLIDPENPENSSFMLFVIAENIEKPMGFEINRTLVVEGKPISKSTIWHIQAIKISTKCPPSYD